MPDIRDIQDQDFFLPEASTPLWWVLALALGIILIGAFALFILRKKPALEKGPSAIDTAREEIALLKQSAPDTPINTTATELSLTIRRYLAGAFHDSALFETNEEFSLREKALPTLQQESKDKISQRLRELNQLKYIPASQRNQTDLIRSQIDEAEDLLDHLELHLNNPRAIAAGPTKL